MSGEVFIKDDNVCFPPDNEGIHYESIIMQELFFIDEFENLFDGLDKIYRGTNIYDGSLNYRKILSDANSFRGILYLPPIRATKFKGHFHSVVFKDLGDSINCISLTLQATLPSIITLQIQASLDSNVSEKVNNTVSTSQPEVREHIKSLNGNFTTIYRPSQIKKKKVNEIRNDLINQIIGFLSIYFEGFFFKRSKKHIYDIQSIDLFSLNYPTKSDDMSKWFSDNNDFLHYFNVFFLRGYAYEYEHYLFLVNPLNDNVFPSYSIIANRNTANRNNFYDDIETAIKEPLNSYSFQLLSLNTWLKIEEMIGTKLVLSTSKELESIAAGNLQKIINNRESITKYVFHFERFKIDFKEFSKQLIDSSPRFVNEKNTYLFDEIAKKINRNVEYMDNYIHLLNVHSDHTLALKNIEYSKNMQNYVLYLTYIVIGISLFQIFLALTQLLLDHLTLKIIISYLIEHLL